MPSPTPHSTPAALRPLADAFRRLENHLFAQGPVSARTAALLQRTAMEIDALAKRAHAAEASRPEAP